MDTTNQRYAINKGGRGKTSILEIEVSKPQITRARYVLRNNNQNRDATPGQKAMATAMAFPDKIKGGRGIKSNLKLDFSEMHLSRARYVLRNNNQNRDATPGQKAMATAMAFPENTDKGGRGKKGKTVDSSNGFDKSTLSRARYVLQKKSIGSF